MLICSEKIRPVRVLSRMLWPKNPDADTLPTTGIKMNKNSILKKSSLFQNTNEMVLNFNLNPSNE